MPVNDCSVDGQPGVKWGDAGKCYTYDPDSEASRKEAVKQALAQGIAIGDIDIERGITLHELEQRAPGDVDLTPTQAMGAAARKGLRLLEEGKGGDGLVPATIRDARRMANGEALSEQKVRRMPAWWARHRNDWTAEDTEDGQESPGYVASLLWGIDSKDGSPGATWAARKVRELDRAAGEEDRAMVEQRDDAPWMTARQRAIYDALEDVAETFGAFDKGVGANGLHYIAAADNDWADDGLACQACAFYRGGGGCELLAATEQVEPEGVCKYWLVPDPNAEPMPLVEEDGEEDDEETPDDMDMTTPDAPEQERSYSPVPVEYRESGAGANYKTIAGYAAVFGKMSEDLGGFREVIAPGAFARALERGDTIKLLYDHDSAAVLASTDNGSLEVREDEVGLHVWARVDMADPDVQRVAAKLRSGVVDQMSFAFTMGEDSDEEWNYTGGVPVRTIRSVSAIWEASVVAFPAYTSTKVALLERARHAGRLPELVGATDVAPDEVGGMSPDDNDRDADPRRSATYWRAKLTQRKQETRKWTS